MKKPLLIVKNMTHEGPGILEEILRKKKLESIIVDLESGDAFPSPKDFSAIIVMGGEDSANDKTEKMKTEIKRIQEAIKLGTPYLGICLGLQTLVKAAGGKVVKNDVREVGFRSPDGLYFSAQLTDDGSNDPLLAGIGMEMPMFHLHGETVELSGGMSLLASGEWCVNQIVLVTPGMYGMQGHLELTDDMFTEWCEKNSWLRECDRAKLATDWAKRKDDLQNTLTTIFGNFLRVAGLI